MNRNFAGFVKEKLHNFTTATTNLLIFFPYLFSVSVLFRTLFSPWKNLRETNPKKGLEGWFSKVSFDATSRLVGSMARAAIILTFLAVESMFIILLPLFFISYAVLIPLFFVLQNDNKKQSEAQKKDEFIKNHLLDPENKASVLAWAEKLFQSRQKLPWWNLKNLMSMPPFARDWTAGYTPTLDQYVEEVSFKNNTSLVGRENEIKHIEQVLSKSFESNILLVGDEGVGKRAIIRDFARRIYNGQTNPLLMYKRVLRLDMEKLLSASSDFVVREETLKAVLKEATDARNIILYIENFEKYVSPADGMLDLSSILVEFADSAHIQFIGITTPFSYQKYIYKNARITKSFEKVDIEEIDEKSALTILLEMVPAYEQRYHTTIPFETVKEVVEKSAIHITTVPFPEKAIDILDEACVFAGSQKASAVLPAAADAVISQKTHVPLEIDASLKDKLLNLETALSEKIIAQTDAVNQTAATIRKAFVLSKTRKKPLSTFLFLGPTGVGKTETAKAIAEVLFGSPDKMIRIDMSQYQTNDTIKQLTGDSAHGNPGILTSAVRQSPYGVLLLDEIEKANMEVLNVFLTMLDEAYFTDGEGKHVDCRNLIIIATSNAGADIAGNETDVIQALLKRGIFTPEFINRFDGVIIFGSLSADEIKTLAEKMITTVSQDIQKKHGILLQVTPQFLDSIIEKGYNPQFGARNMAHIIQNEIENKIAQVILEQKVRPGQVVTF